MFFAVTAFWDITKELLSSTPEGFLAASSSFSQGGPNMLDKFFFILLLFFPRDKWFLLIVLNRPNARQHSFRMREESGTQSSQLQSSGWKFSPSCVPSPLLHRASIVGQDGCDVQATFLFLPATSTLRTLSERRAFTFSVPSPALTFQTAPVNSGAELAQGYSHQHLLTVVSL